MSDGVRGPGEGRTNRARALRRVETEVERQLWFKLNNRQLADAKFVRQEPIGRYFVDFVCREQKLVVELDGSQHADSEHDRVRDAELVRLGYRVLRFWNNELRDNLQGVLETIYAALMDSRDVAARQKTSPRLRGEAEQREARPGEGAPPAVSHPAIPPHPDGYRRLDLSPPGGKREVRAKPLPSCGERTSRAKREPGEGASPPQPHPAIPPHPDGSAVSTSPRQAGRGEDLRFSFSQLRGSLTANAPLALLSWFRTGGTADLLFAPADEDDLAACLARLPADIPVLVIGLGSNLLVRDGGVPGVVIRLGRAFSAIAVEPGHRVRAGAGAADVKVARAAAEAGIAGLSFLRGIPGTIGGALRMNGGAYGGETADVLVEARGLTRTGERATFDRAGMGFTYRHCDVTDDVIFTEAVFQGVAGDPTTILAEMGAITEARSATQPVNTRTGGSTFRNPPGRKAWELIDAAGCRGLRIGDAQVSELHCNFLINHGKASAAEIEALGEEVRRRVREQSGVELVWEIKRVGVAG